MADGLYHSERIPDCNFHETSILQTQLFLHHGALELRQFAPHGIRHIHALCARGLQRREIDSSLLGGALHRIGCIPHHGNLLRL